MSEQQAVSVPQWTRGDRLGKALDFAGLSVSAMADYLGVSRNTVGNYVNDRTGIPRPTLILWSMKTGVPIEWIEEGVEPSGPNGPDGGGRKDGDQLARLTDQKRSRTIGTTTRRYLAPSAFAA